MSGGVFITVRVHDARIRADLEYLKVGKGNYFTFFRPYHLWFLEAPISVALAALRKQIWLTPQDQPVADVLTVAKKSLQPGDALDTFGGYTFYGAIDRAEIVRAENGLPVGLAPGAKVVRPVAAGPGDHLGRRRAGRGEHRGQAAPHAGRAVDQRRKTNDGGQCSFVSSSSTTR